MKGKVLLWEWEYYSTTTCSDRVSLSPGIYGERLSRCFSCSRVILPPGGRLAIEMASGKVSLWGDSIYNTGMFVPIELHPISKFMVKIAIQEVQLPIVVVTSAEVSVLSERVYEKLGVKSSTKQHVDLVQAGENIKME